jgi:hypothetical protein
MKTVLVRKFKNEYVPVSGHDYVYVSNEQGDEIYVEVLAIDYKHKQISVKDSNGKCFLVEKNNFPSDLIFIQELH